MKPDELSVEQIERIARNLGPLMQLSLTGGEPFLRKDLSEITRILIRHTHARYVTIPTNASLPERIVSYLEEILPACPDSYFRVVLSIEAIGEEHDRLRSRTGSYNKVKESYAAIDPLRRKFHNLVLDSNSVFTAHSEHNLLETIRHISQSFHFDNISVTYARGNIKDPGIKLVSEDRYRAINSFLETLDRCKERRALYPFLRGIRDVSRELLVQTVFKDKFVLPCVAGRKLIIISETGEVFPCEILGKSMGNLRDFNYDLKKLLDQPENRKLVRWILDSKCKCSFECALGANVIWNPSIYPKLILASMRNIGKNRACVSDNGCEQANSY
jgi:radical SAM protein with 4Fe4S-binding SPASM domain